MLIKSLWLKYFYFTAIYSYPKPQITCSKVNYRAGTFAALKEAFDQCTNNIHCTGILQPDTQNAEYQICLGYIYHDFTKIKTTNMYIKGKSVDYFRELTSCNSINTKWKHFNSYVASLYFFII